MFKCDFEVMRMLVKPSEFHKLIFNYWKMIFSHNFPPHGGITEQLRLIGKQYSNKNGLIKT